MLKTKGRVAIITGGSSGLGEATVIELVNRGCKVIVADVDSKHGKELELKYGPDTVKFIETDVSNEDHVKSLVEKTLQHFGAIHIVVNSAGILVRGEVQSKEVDVEQFWKVFKINVLGTFLVTKYTAMHMMKQDPVNTETKERGVIINVGSIGGIEGPSGEVLYSGTKGAIHAMTLPLARDLGKFGIRVITIAPQVFETPMKFEEIKSNSKAIQMMRKITALGRLGSPSEFANCVASLCMNSYITGEVIRLDGGVRVPHL